MFDDFDTKVNVEELNEADFNEWYANLHEEEIAEELARHARWEDEARKAGIFDNDLEEAGSKNNPKWDDFLVYNSK